MSDDAVERYKQMLAEDPQSRAFAPLAEAHRKAGRLEEAIKVARAGLEVHPGYSGGLIVLGRALYEKGELDNAVEVLQKAVTETPDNYLGQKFLGKVLMDKGESKGALRALEAANLLSPEDEEVSRLLDEVKSKATSPETMDYKEKEAEAGEKAQIVTYEQKPTTVDGVELPPLPGGEIVDTYSFSGGGTDDPADVTPVVAEEEIPSADTNGSEMNAVGMDEENMTATVIEEEEVEQTMEIESLDELGPEAAAFIQEGENLVEDSMEDLPDEESGTVGEMMEEVVVEAGEVQPAPEPVSAPEPAPAPAPEPSPMPEPVPAPEPSPAPEPVPAPEPELPSAAPVLPEPPLQETSREEQFSTETLADLYAQQGLIGKATNIYRQILEQVPDNETVKLKLDALEAQTPPAHPPEPAPEPEPVPEPPPAAPVQPEPPQKDENEDKLNVLEGLLENVERIKRP
jgi:tetratricopeptide (TPR) repeat protein